MAGSLRTSRSVGPLGLAAAAGVALGLSSPWAEASSGLGVIGNPGQVAIAPAAARVQLTGLFAVGAGGADPCYSTPRCGTLYYACPPGEEARCQMEWGEIKEAAVTGKCVGFGSPRTNTGAPLDNGRVRVAGELLGAPDVYPLGLGVHVGPCTGLEFTCSLGLDVSARRARACAGPTDAGVDSPTETGSTTGSGGVSGTTGSGGVSGTSSGGVSGTTGSGGGAAPSDAGGKGEIPGKSGCSLAAPASRSMSGGGVLLVGLWVTVIRRRRGDRSGRRS